MDAKLYTYTYPQGCLSLGYSAKKNNEKNVQNPHESDVIPKSGSFMQIHLFDIFNSFHQTLHLTTLLLSQTRCILVHFVYITLLTLCHNTMI